jgi:hypothetical protein
MTRSSKALGVLPARSRRLSNRFAKDVAELLEKLADGIDIKRLTFPSAGQVPKRKGRP